METIIYQGQEVRAQLVNFVSGDGITTSTHQDFSGDEDLFRDEAGRYYLRQKLDWLDYKGDEERPASGRTRVHRINVNAAILWATTRLNSVTSDLRADAANLLTEGRFYSDPHPVHLSAEQLAMVRHPERFAKALDTDGTITVPLKADELADPLGHAPRSGRITVELDALASAMLRRVWSEGNSCREAGEDPRDLVNAAVTYYLCDDSDHRHGQFDLDCGDDVLARAKGDRLAREGKEVA